MKRVEKTKLKLGDIYTESLELKSREAFIVIDFYDDEIIAKSRKTMKVKSVKKANYCFLLGHIDINKIPERDLLDGVMMNENY